MNFIPCLLVLFLVFKGSNLTAEVSKNDVGLLLDPKENKSLVVIGGDVYFIGTNPPLSWLDSLRMCTSLGMTLASMEHQDKYQLVYDFILNEPEYSTRFYWTSGARTMENAFIWTNLARELTFAPWAPGEPSSNGIPGDTCLILAIGRPSNLEDGFHDTSCPSIADFICQL